MFRTAWPESARTPASVRDAVHTFDILRKVLQRMHGGSSSMRDEADLKLDHTTWVSL